MSSSNSSLDYRRDDARIAENGFATSSGVSKSAKVVLVTLDRFRLWACDFGHGEICWPDDSNRSSRGR
jgi:hypothetical protein